MQYLVLIVIGVVAIVAYATKHGASNSTAMLQTMNSDPDLKALLVVIVSQILVVGGWVWFQRRNQPK